MRFSVRCLVLRYVVRKSGPFLSSAIAAAVIWGFANDTARLPRQSHEEIQALIEVTDLEAQMRSVAVWDAWEAGSRGRH